jgi:pyruvate carboxylase subunit B
MLFEEVEYVWPKLGYPPLVTPFSQYVKNMALMNVMASIKGEKRWTMIDNHTWDMILGKEGKLPGTLAPEIIELAHTKGFEFSDDDPQKNYPDELDAYRKEMRENGWDLGENEEELFELAMHDRQYRDYKSGIAKKRFEDELQRAKDVALCSSRGFSAEELRNYKRAKAEPLIATAKGQVLWEIDVVSPSQAPVVGRKYNEEEVFCYIATSWGCEEIKTGFGGRVVEICCKQGRMVEKGEILGYVEREK